MKTNYRCCCTNSGRCSYVEKLQAIIYQMEKDGGDLSHINFYISENNDISMKMILSENRVDITCGLACSSDENIKEYLNDILQYFSEDDESGEDFDEDCTPEIKLENAKDRIRKASGKNFAIVIVESINGDKKQAQAQVDGKTIKMCKGLIDDLDEDELAGIIAHEVAHLEKREETNSKRKEVDNESIGTKLRKMDESLKNSGAGTFTRKIAQVAVVGIGVIGGTIVAKAKTRKEEDDADSRAVDILYKAGYNPEAVADALERTDDQTCQRRNFLENVLSAHPEARKRIKKIREKAKNKV